MPKTEDFGSLRINTTMGSGHSVYVLTVATMRKRHVFRVYVDNETENVFVNPTQTVEFRHVFGDDATIRMFSKFKHGASAIIVIVESASRGVNIAQLKRESFWPF
jgi:hypothetical protein